MKITTFKSLFKRGRGNLMALASLLLLSGTASAQITAYSRTQLTGQTYTQISGGTVINTDAQLTTGASNNQNDGFVLVTLPFTFTYGGSTYTQATFCTNGWVGMGNQTALGFAVSRTPGNLFVNTTPNNVIAPWFGDLGGNWPGPLGNGSMAHGSAGTDVYAFEWRNANGNGSTAVTLLNNINFKVLIYGPASATPGRIEFLYGSQTGSVLTNRSVGIEGLTGGTGDYINAIDGYTNTTTTPSAWPGNGNGYRFDPPAACTGTPVAGTPLPLQSIVCINSVPPAINMTGVSVGAGILYQWEESTNGGTSWVNAVGGTGATSVGYIPPAYNGTPKQYRLKTTCSNSGQTVYSAGSFIISPSAPSTQASGLRALYNANSATFEWTNGNGNTRLIAISSSPIVDPPNGVQIPTYPTNLAWQNAGQQYVYNGTNASTAVLTGLTCGATYYVKVYEYNKCGSGTGPYDTYMNVSGGTNEMTFVAQPQTVSSLPIAPTFTGFIDANLGYVQPGWYESTGASGAVEPGIVPTGISDAWVGSTVFGIPTVKRFFFSNNQNGWFISPKMTLTTASRLKFKAAITDRDLGTADPTGMQGTDDKFRIMVSVDGCGAVWTPLYTFDASNTINLTNVLTDYVVSLGAYTGQTVQIAFQVASGPINNTGVQYDFHIGSLVIENLPPCAAPVINDVTAITKNTATISWQLPAAGTPTAYEYAVVTTNTAPASGTETTLTSINLTSATLSPSTTYYVFVRTKCTDVYSDWSISKIFSTLCNYPDLLSSTGAAACGLGQATVNATASPGGIINWYAAANGGAPLATGASYTVSGLTATTNYYVSSATTIPKDVVVGTPTGFSPVAGISPYFNNAGGAKTQYIIRASELMAAGLYAGPINSLAISVGNAGGNVYSGFAVSIGQTTQNVATTTHITGLTQVYANAVQVLTSGFNNYAFTAPFAWDGTSNLVVQVCFSNNDAGNGDATTWSNVNSYATGFNSNTVTQASFVTPDALCSAVGQGGTVGTTSIATSRPVMSFNGIGLCSGPRATVAVTVTDAPDIAASISDNAICVGESTNLSVTSINPTYAYSWMPGNLSGATQTVSPAETTTYTVRATDTASGCVESAQVVVTVNALPNAITIIPAAPVFCQNTMGMLTASGSGTDYVWSPIAGLFTDLAGTVAYTGGSAATVYYYADEDATFTATVTNANGCSVSADVDVTVTIIAAPEAAASQTVCNAGTVADLMTTSGIGILWYADQIGGEPLDAAAPLVNGENYFASQIVGGCESVARTEVTVTINVIAAPEANAAQTICNTGTVADLQTTTGENVKWYADATGGVALENTEALVDGESYFASQTVNGCESVTRTEVTVTINVIAAPQANATLTLCNTGTVADLQTTSGESIKWYADAEGGEALADDTVLSDDEDYFASQTVNGCESAVRTAVIVTINAPAAPTGAAVQEISTADATLEDVVIEGVSGIVTWYATLADAQAGENALDVATALIDGEDYFAVQTIEGCTGVDVFEVTIDLTLGTKGFDVRSFTYSPNPVKNVLNLAYSSAIDSITVYNMPGQIVMSQRFNAPQAALDMSNLADGTYMLKVTSGEVSKTVKVIKVQ